MYTDEEATTAKDESSEQEVPQRIVSHPPAFGPLQKPKARIEWNYEKNKNLR